MSRDRSFQHMQEMEVLTKDLWDRHRLLTLEKGFWHPIKRYKLGGLDEAWYVFKHKLRDRTKKQKQYLQNQIELNTRRKEELGIDDNYDNSWVYQRLRQAEPNPATFRTLRDHRQAFRAARIKKMKDVGGEKLFINEKSAYLQQTLFEKIQGNFTNTLGFFGDRISDVGSAVAATGSAIRNNLILIGAAGLIGTTGWSGWNWYKSAEQYKFVARDYASTPIGHSSLRLKREVVDLANMVEYDLTYVPEQTCTDDDGNSYTCVHEKESMPRRAKQTLATMQRIVDATLHQDRLNIYSSVVENQRGQLPVIASRAHARFGEAQNMLPDNIYSYHTFYNEINKTWEGIGHLQSAVGILEGAMDPSVVAAENEAFDTKTFWRNSTYALMVTTFLLFGGAAKSANSYGYRRSRRRHYGY